MGRTAAQNLRWGYATGTCATAVAVAAWQCVAHSVAQHESIDILFPDGLTRTLPLLPADTIPNFVTIRKDGGDDPDCTHDALIYAKAEPCTFSDAKPEDYILPIGTHGHAIIHAVEGIGRCTRIGLDCEQGKWAINTTPRVMLQENLAKAGLKGCWKISLGVRNGAALARNTLNPQLGIVGGISILGTSGLVRPYSHDAYRETIRICVRSHHLSGGTHMVFCTGGRTRKGAGKLLPHLPETAFVCIGDFIAESLEAAQHYSMQEITVACMAGKLCKYAAGFENTHAHTVAQDMELLREEIRRVLASLPHDERTEATFAPDFHDAPTVREALLHIPQALRHPVLEGLAAQALSIFASRCSTKYLRIALFDFDGSFIFESSKETS